MVGTILGNAQTFMEKTLESLLKDPSLFELIFR